MTVPRIKLNILTAGVGWFMCRNHVQHAVDVANMEARVRCVLPAAEADKVIERAATIDDLRRDFDLAIRGEPIPTLNEEH